MQSAGPESWHPNPDFLFQEGAGPLFDIGPYYLTTLVQLFGPIARVTAAAFDPASDATAVRAEIDRLADLLLPVLHDWATLHELDALIVENAWAIPMHLPLGLALRRLVEETRLPTIGHHHDYWWERERFATCVVPEVLEEAFPPDLPSVKHVSINSLAARALRDHRPEFSRIGIGLSGM